MRNSNQKIFSHKVKFKEKIDVAMWSKVTLPHPFEPKVKMLIISPWAHPLPELWHLFQLWDDSQHNKEPYHLHLSIKIFL